MAMVWVYAGDDPERTLVDPGYNSPADHAAVTARRFDTSSPCVAEGPLMKLKFVFAPLLTLCAVCPGDRAAEKKGELSQVPLPAGLVAPQAKAQIAALVCFLEGPAVDEKGNVFFSDITSNRILKMIARGEVSVFRED